MFILIIDTALTLCSKLAQALFNLVAAYLFNAEEYWMKLGDHLVEVNADLSQNSLAPNRANVRNAFLNFLLEQWWFSYNLVDFLAYNISVTWHNLYGALKETWADIARRYHFSDYVIYAAIYRACRKILTSLLQGPLPLLIAASIRFILPRIIALLLLGPISSMYLFYPTGGRYFIMQLLIIYDFILILMIVYNALANAIISRKNKK
jgi:hypothetical protein